MLVNITQDFDTGNKRYYAGDQAEVPIDIARKWIADGWAYPDITGGTNSSSFADIRLRSSSLGQLVQSIWAGSCSTFDQQNEPQRQYFDAPEQGYFEGSGLGCGYNGSPMVPVIAKLARVDKHKVFFSNGGLGGASFIREALGYVRMEGYVVGTFYRGKRDSLAAGDPGTRGDVIRVNGGNWECTRGNRHLAFINSDVGVVAGTTAAGNDGVTYYRNLTSVAKDTNIRGGTVAPTFPAASVGAVVEDTGAGSTNGGLQWTCIAVTSAAADQGNIRILRTGDVAFDPYFMLSRLATSIIAQPSYSKNRFCYVSNGSADAGYAQTNLYRLALQLIASYFVPRGIRMIYGLDPYYPQQLVADWDLLEIARSSTGINGTPDYFGSPLSLALGGVDGTGGSGYGLPGTPGGAQANYYYTRGSYRGMGVGAFNASRLQQPQPNPHYTQLGYQDIADCEYPYIRNIVLNQAIPIPA
jgi:hypothetical protein